ncbi:hypothetical protein tb265_00260 [Gemmatimonadetes bacterium T265]|nr:hypothetical protein tb265_00260 [Gemmatimonadetes bacterium T265]
MRPARVLLGVAALSARPCLTAAQPASAAPRPDFAAVRDLTRRAMAADSVPALAVAVARGGRVVWAEGFGAVDAAGRVPATARTPFPVASVTKAFTATAILGLAGRGRLALDRPANAYLAPGARLASAGPWDPAGATVRRLLTHTGGLTTFARTCPADRAGCGPAQMDTTIRRYGVLMWPAGDHFDYTNLGYGVLGAVAAHAAGRPLAALLRDDVFGPLGLDDASLGLDAVRTSAQRAAALPTRRGTHPRGDPGSFTPGASDGYASARDLARFGLVALGTARPSRGPDAGAATRAAVACAVTPTGGAGRYGCGWWVEPDYHGVRSILAQGGTDAASARLRLVPDAGLAVAVVANAGTLVPDRVIEAVLDALLPGFRTRRVRDSTAAATPSTTQVSGAPVASAPPAALVGVWIGAVRTPHGAVPITLTVSPSGVARAPSGVARGRLGTAPDATLREVELGPADTTGAGPRSAHLGGRLSGDLYVADDAGPGPYDVYVELYRRGESLVGTATTLPGAAAPNGALLSYAVVLRHGAP